MKWNFLSQILGRKPREQRIQNTIRESALFGTVFTWQGQGGQMLNQIHTNPTP